MTTWVHYRGLVVLALLVVGNLFCMACPLMLPREAGRWLGLRLGWQRTLPRRQRNKCLAVCLLMAYFFIYELFDFWASPWLTAYLDESFAIAMYGMVDLVGKKKALAGYKDNPYSLDTGKFVREWYWE